MADPYAELKTIQKQGWTRYAALESHTTAVAGHLVEFAGVRAGQKVLDVATGTGPVAITAARKGAQVTGVDFTPELLAHAKENAALAEVDQVTWKEGDAEALPVPDASFDVVLSQFGHIFAPRHQLAADELLRVLKPGGTLALATWPTHGLIPPMTALFLQHMPPPPPGLEMKPPGLWGDTAYVRERLGARVKDLVFDTGTMGVPALSPGHFIAGLEGSLAPAIMALQMLKDKPKELAEFRRAWKQVAATYTTRNVVRHDYLLTRATKA